MNKLVRENYSFCPAKSRKSWRKWILCSSYEPCRHTLQT